MKPFARGDRFASTVILSVFRDEAHTWIYEVRDIATNHVTHKTHAQVAELARAEKHDLG